MSLLCPSCRTDLVMSERTGVEIDYCPKCRGVWLDRGELDKILERAEQSGRPSTANVAAAPPGAVNASLFGGASVAQRRSDVYRGRGDDGDDDHDRRRQAYPARRKSWLSDIFD